MLLEDWVLRCLDGQAAPEAAARREAVAAALRDLGFQLTRTGIRRAASDVDRLLTGSAAKPIALVEVLGAEAEARGTDLRALVLCDAELAGARPDGELRDVLDPDAGTARAAVRALAERHAHRACCARCWCPAAACAARRRTPRRCWPRWREARSGAARRRAGAAAPPRGRPRRAARARGLAPAALGRACDRDFEAGETRALVGTRAFLGEGWNAPCVNCLVDLTSAATGVSVRQMRGRSLRLDPADPEKVASNWDVVCVAPRHAQGDADYERFVRKHRHLHAPADDGTLEAGVGHVHPDLSPFAPPPADHFAAIARAMTLRAADRDAARARWRIGTPYEGHEVETLVLHPRRPAPPRPRSRRRRRRALRVGERALLGGGALAALAAAGRRGRGRPARARRPAAGGRRSPPPRCARAAHRRGAAARRRAARPHRARGLRRVRRARRAAARGRRLARVRAARVRLPALPPARRHAGGGRARDRRARRAARAGRAPALPALAAHRPARPVGGWRCCASPPGGAGRSSTAWHAVPDDLGRRKERAEALAAAWRRWLGPAELRFTQRDGPGREALAEAAAQEWSYDTQRRAVWQ